MTFTPTPETVEAVAEAIYPTRHPRGTEQLKATHREMARAAIAAFVEAEGLTMESDLPDTYEDRIREYRLVGPWREA